MHTNLTNGLYSIYLRKSREDLEAELHGEGDTLLRHERRLMDLAKKMNLNIGQVYREIVSGESIDARPEVKKLIHDVEQGKWKGVLVVEVERLARGDTLDQGIIARAFTISGTKIITPLKIYDPANPSDMEYFEFGLFMSRREYATINRRIQDGRKISTMEGKWIYGEAPYGYERIKISNDKGYALKPLEGEAAAVLLMYQWYANEHVGSYTISIRLDERGYRNRRGEKFSPSSIRDILKNPVYAGYVTWGKRPEVKQIEDGHVVKKRIQGGPEMILKRGLHDAIIPQELFDAAQTVRSTRAVRPNNFASGSLQNPLAGIVCCKCCGHTMRRQKDNKGTDRYRLVCNTVRCENISSRFDLVEDAVIDALQSWTDNYILKLEKHTKETDTFEEDLERLKNERTTLESQKGKLFDFLERGIYDENTFIERNKNLAGRIEEMQQHIENLIARHQEQAAQMSTEEFIKQVKHVQDAYGSCSTNEEKNMLLKSIFKRIDYVKKEKGPGKETAFSLDFYPVVDFSRH